MSLEGPKRSKNEEGEKTKVVKGPLDIVKTPMQRMEQVGRRGIIKLGAAAGASYVVAEVATPLTTPMALEKVMPNKPAELPSEEREKIEREIKSFVEARKKGGLIGGAEKWFDNLVKGIDKHGFDVMSAWKEFSEEGLRARLFKYDVLKESYDSMYSMGYGATHYVLYAAYAAGTFYVVEKGISDYFKHKSALEKDRKIQDAVNGLAADIEGLRAHMRELQELPLVSKADFDALLEDMKKLDQTATPLLRDLSGNTEHTSDDRKSEER